MLKSPTHDKYANVQPANGGYARVKSYRVKFTGSDGVQHDELRPFTDAHAKSMGTVIETDGIPIWAATELVARWIQEDEVQRMKREYSIPFVSTEKLMEVAQAPRASTERDLVIQLAINLKNQAPTTSNNDATSAALRSIFGLSQDDAIWGGSRAAVAMGFAGHADTEDLFERIAKKVEEDVITAAGIDGKPGATNSIDVKFESRWEEGIVTTGASLDLNTGIVFNIVESDEGSGYESLMGEFVLIGEREVAVEVEPDNNYRIDAPTLAAIKAELNAHCNNVADEEIVPTARELYVGEVIFDACMRAVEKGRSLEGLNIDEIALRAVQKYHGKAEPSQPQFQGAVESKLSDTAALVTLNLNVFDDVGNVVDGTTATLSVAQLSDIVDQASQLILIRRDGQSLNNVLDALDESLSTADVIEAPAEATQQSPRG